MNPTDQPIFIDCWGIACQECANEPHDCEECLAQAGGI